MKNDESTSNSVEDILNGSQTNDKANNSFYDFGSGVMNDNRKF